MRTIPLLCLLAVLAAGRMTPAAPVLTFQDTSGDLASVSVVPGGTFSFNTSVNSGTMSLSGISYYLQASVAGKFSVTNQTVATGSSFSDPERAFSLPITLSTSGSGDFGWSTASNSNVGAGTYALDTLSFSVDPSTAIGSYTISSNSASGIATTNPTPPPQVMFTNFSSPATYTINVLAASTWSGAAGGGLWSSPGNWDAQPINGTNIFFAGSGASPAPTNDSFLTSVGSITFNSGAASFTLGGSSVSIAGGITNNSTSLQTINLGLTLTGPQQLNAAGGALTVNGAIATGGNTLSIAGSSNVTLAGAISGTGELSKSGSGILTVSGNNSYGGGTTVSGTGTLIVGHSNALGTGALAINNTAVARLQAGLSAPVQLTSLTIAGGMSLTADFDVSGVVENTVSSGLESQSLATSVAAVPEPSSVILVAIGLIAVALVTIRKGTTVTAPA